MELLRARNGARDRALRSSKRSSKSSSCWEDLGISWGESWKGSWEDPGQGLGQGTGEVKKIKSCLGDHMSKSAALAPCSPKRGYNYIIYGGGPEPVLSKSFARRYHAFKGSNCSKTLCHSSGMGRSVKTQHYMQIAISPRGLRRMVTWGLAFFRFFISMFSCWIPNRVKSGFHTDTDGV